MTTEFICNKEQFTAAKEAISQHMEHKSLTAADIIFYNAIRNKPLDHGFTGRTNPGRLTAMGNDPMGAYKWALQTLASTFRYSKRCLGITITDDIARKIFPTWR